MKKQSLLFFTVLLVFLVCIYKLFTQFYIVAKFKELRPHFSNLAVYYKGIVVGRAVQKVHSKDYQHTLMKIILYKNNMLLPSNTTILLKKEKRNKKERDFLELVYPKEPTKIMLSKGSVIEGISTVDIDTFMSNHHPDDLEEIKENLINASENLESSLMGLSDLFVLLQDVVRENQPNIKKATKNFASTTGNLNDVTLKFNNSVEQKSINKTMSNIDNSIENLNIVAQRADLIADETLETMCNLNKISCGIRKTLSKCFGGVRLFFGKVID